MKTRIEKDSLGTMEIPEDALYGPQTARAILNFPISGWKAYPETVEAIVHVKRAAAIVNARLGTLDPKKSEAIIKAADEVLSGQHRDQFAVDVFQAGAGTSFNMNANEVLANRAIDLLGGKRGDTALISPNDHVNCAQSTNDVFPTAMKISCLLTGKKLAPVLHALQKTLEAKAAEFDGILKAGRTHLQDAVPIRLGQEFGGYAAVIQGHEQRLDKALEGLTALGIGGTAVGTGLNAHPDYRFEVCGELSKKLGSSFVPAANLPGAMQSMAAEVELSAALRGLALDLTKIANDLRLLASGPRTGLAEIELPAVQPGSSIMPGKVNPVLAEMLNMVCFQVIGNDAAVACAAQAGQLELNVMMPVICFNLMTSLTILRTAMDVFTSRCVAGITANVKRCGAYAEKSLANLTALNPHIGYLNAAEVAKEMLASEDRTAREIALEKKLLPKEDLDRVLNLERMTRAAEKHKHP